MTTAGGHDQRPAARVVVGTVTQPLLVRSGAFAPVAAASVLAIGAALVARILWGSADAVHWSLVMGVLLLAGSVGFALDDPTEPTTAASPTTLLERRSHRLVPTAGATVAGWGASVAAAGEGAVGGPTLMLVGLGLACAAAAAVATHRAPGRAGVVASTFALASVLVLSRLPERWTMLPRPGGSLDRAAVLRWIGIAAVALGALVVASREPARTR